MLDGLWKALTGPMSSWHQGKLFIEHMLAISHNSLHIFIGVLPWIALGPAPPPAAGVMAALAVDLHPDPVERDGPHDRAMAQPRSTIWRRARWTARVPNGRAAGLKGLRVGSRIAVRWCRRVSRRAH